LATSTTAQNGSQQTKTQDQGEYLVEHGLRQHFTEQVDRAGEVIGGAGSCSLAMPGRSVAHNRHAVEVGDRLERATIHRELCRNTEARWGRRLGRWLARRRQGRRRLALPPCRRRHRAGCGPKLVVGELGYHLALEHGGDVSMAAYLAKASAIALA
jgi:hypothetical protein